MSDILVALDVPTLDEATTLARAVEPHVAGFKIGLELLYGAGPLVLAAIGALGKPVLADVKLHDIPNTVEHAARQLAGYGVRWITVHALAGADALAAAATGLGRPGVLAVTVLTSHRPEDLAELGLPPTAETIARLATVAAKSGAEGIVAAVPDLATVAEAAPGLLTVTPGIRQPSDPPGDQARTATPAEARAAGADYLVIGRPITRSADPAAAAAALAL